jgi:hypothetical protein
MITEKPLRFGRTPIAAGQLRVRKILNRFWTADIIATRRAVSTYSEHFGILQSVQFMSTLSRTDLGSLKNRYFLEPIHEVWIHEQEVGFVKRLSMRRIMARRTKAATVEA